MSRSLRCVRQAAMLGLLLGGQSALADENPGQPAAADSAQGEPARRPLVRTYTSVTVVNDPTQIPRLPSRVPAPERPRREDRVDIGRERERPESVRELRQEVRQELREVRRELREPEHAAEQRPAGPGTVQREANRAAAAERQERRIERIERKAERAGQAPHR